MKKVEVGRKDDRGGKVTKIVEEAPSVRSRNESARGAAVAAQGTQTEARRQQVNPTPPPLPPPPGSAHSLAPGGSGGDGRGRCSDREARAAARPRSCPAAPRGSCRARPGRPGDEFLNFLGKLWSRHCRDVRGNKRRRKRRSRRRRKRKQSLWIHLGPGACLDCDASSEGELRRDGRPRGGDVQSRRLSEDEGSLAEEPGFVSRGGDAGRAADRGRRRPEPVRGVPRERVVGPLDGVPPLWAGKPRTA